MNISYETGAPPISPTRFSLDLRKSQDQVWRRLGGGRAVAPMCVFQMWAPATGKARDLFILALFTCTSAVNKIIDWLVDWLIDRLIDCVWHRVQTVRRWRLQAPVTVSAVRYRVTTASVYLCDGDYDCTDRSDEANCGQCLTEQRLILWSDRLYLPH